MFEKIGDGKNFIGEIKIGRIWKGCSSGESLERDDDRESYLREAFC